MQTLACHQIKYAGEITGVQQLGDHQLMQIAVLSGMQQVSENQVGSTCVTSVACDPYWNNVVLAMHMDGTNGSTTFTDEKGHTVTAYGDVEISTVESKFGGASSAFDGSGDYLSVPYSTDFNIESSDFTIELFIRLNAVGVRQEILEKRLNALPHNTGWGLLITNTDTVRMYTTSFGSLESSGMLSVNTWNHIAVVRESGSCAIYINGVLSGSGSLPDGLPDTDMLYIGTDHTLGDYPLNGYIDDLRITKGVARYTSDFTPPTTPFADVACT